MVDAVPADGLLTEIYEAIALDDGWPPALRTVMRVIDADSGCICWKPSAVSPLAEIASIGLDVPSYLNRYREEIERLDIPFYRLFRDRPAGDFVAFGKEAFDSGYQRSAFFNEWAKPLGFGDVAGAHLIRDHSLYGWFSVRRAYGKGPFPTDKLALARSLVPHLSRALKIWTQIQTARVIRGSLVAALDLLTFSLIIVDDGARILYANRSAERLLSHGGVLGGLHGQLRCRYHDQHKALLKAVHDTAHPTTLLASTETDRAIVLQTADGTSIAIHAVPISPDSGWGTVAPAPPAVALFIADRDSTSSRPFDAFAKRHGLTRMERRVLVEIIGGHGVQHAAETLRIGAATARSHLLNIFLKTGSRKQAELVRLFFEQTVPISQHETKIST